MMLWCNLLLTSHIDLRRPICSWVVCRLCRNSTSTASKYCGTTPSTWRRRLTKHLTLSYDHVHQPVLTTARHVETQWIGHWRTLRRNTTRYAQAIDIRAVWQQHLLLRTWKLAGDSLCSANSERSKVGTVGHQHGCRHYTARDWCNTTALARGR